MITIESTMLVALGFLLATLIAVLLAPAYRARAMRLTYKHMRRVMPLTESELLLDRDRLRAHYAVRIHELETKLEKLRLAAARQQVEVTGGRHTRAGRARQLRSELEESAARRVLRRTLASPRVTALPKPRLDSGIAMATITRYEQECPRARQVCDNAQQGLRSSA